MDQSQQPEKWERLWAAVRTHDVEPGELGEYASVLLERNASEAEQAFPSVAAHMREQCDRCTSDLAELQQLLRDEEPARQAAPVFRPLALGAPVAEPRRWPGAWKYAVGVAAAAVVAVPSAVAASMPGVPFVVQTLLLLCGLASLAMLLLVTNGWALRSHGLALAGAGVTLTRPRRAFLLGVAATWLLGTAGIYALPSAPIEPILVVGEPSLQPWANEVINRDPGLSAMGWRILTPEEAARHPPDAQIRLGITSSRDVEGQQGVPVARSTYVVAVWESSLDRLGLRAPTPVDWLAIQAAVADPNGPRFVLPLPGTPLGDDGLLLLALAHQSPNATSLRADPARDAALLEWLAPLYRRQTRLRSDERIQVDDWWRYRNGVGDAGLLAEHDALELMGRLPTQSGLHVRYPGVDVTRTYSLAPAARREVGQAFERLRGALLSTEAQQALWSSGLRPVANATTPREGPFLTQRARGADSQARWSEAARTEVFTIWARTWRP